MPPKVSIQRRGKAIVDVIERKNDGREIIKKSTDDFDMPPLEFQTPPVLLNLSFSRTLNTGNFESLRIVVGLTMPCKVEYLEQAYKETKKFVEEHLQQELDEALGGDDEIG